MKQKILAEPILTGREKELEALQVLLNLAVEGKGKTVFISGEAGTGKTRLIKEFLNKAKQKQHISTLSGYCLSNAVVPYFPFFEAFTNYFSTENNQANKPANTCQIPDQTKSEETGQIRSEIQNIKSWFIGPAQSEKLGRYETISPQVWKDQTFIAVTQTLSDISNDKTIILVLEDIHFADSASLSLMHYIGRAIGCKRILVLATYRSEALTTDSQGHPHPLVETLRQMRREDLYEEIKLLNLDQSNASLIVKSILGGNLQQEIAEKLAKESQGNPLFIVESLRMLHERDSLTQENNQWHLSVNELEIPTKIKDIILQRLSTLIRNQRRAIDAASVIGDKFEVELLSAVLGQDSLEVLETLNVVAQSTSLISCVGDSFRFDHAKSRDAIYEEIPSALKKGYHARIAERMENASNFDKLPLSDLAYHYALAEDKEKAVKYALAAGEDALARWSNNEASRHFSYILENVSKNPENAEAKIRAQEGLGDAYYAQGMFKEATRIFENLSHNETGIIKLRALRKAMESTFQYMDFTHLMELVKEAEPYAAFDRLENARVLSNRARIHFFNSGLTGASRVTLALEDMEAALRVFEEEYSLRDAALALIGMGAFHRGEPQKAIAESLRSIGLYEELGDFRFQMEACYVAGLNFFALLLNSEALDMWKKTIEIDDKMKMGDYKRPALANAFSSWPYELMSDWEEALLYNNKALELSKKTENPVIPGMVYSNLSREYVRLGDFKHAEENFEKLMELPPEVRMNPYINEALTKAVFFAGKSQWKESNQCFNEYIEFFKVMYNLGNQLFGRQFYAWALEKQGQVDEVRIQLEEIQKNSREMEEKFAHANLQASMMGRREVRVGEEFELRFDLVNVSRKPGLLVKIEGVIPSDGFKVTALPPYFRLQNGIIEIKKREIGAFQVETVKITLQAVKNGAYVLNPRFIYVDESGETKTAKLNQATITVQPAQPTIHAIPGRISSGFPELDELLQGGIPENYALVLASPSSDERELLVKRFLQAGAEADETTFYLTMKTGNAKTLAEEYPSNFYVFLCNPRAEAMMPGLANVARIKGVESLTEIDIAMTKAFRALNPSNVGPKRACIEIVSDVLLQHRAVITRKWLSGLLPDLKAKGFTTLAVIDSQMHPQEELQATLGLFEGEIRIYEKEILNGVEKVLRIQRFDNQKYVRNELILTTEKLEQSK